MIRDLEVKIITYICRHAICILAVFTHNVIDSGEGWAVCLWYTIEWDVNMEKWGDMLECV